MGFLCAHSFTPSCVYLFCGFCSPFMCLSFETPYLSRRESAQNYGAQWQREAFSHSFLFALKFAWFVPQSCVSPSKTRHEENKFSSPYPALSAFLSLSLSHCSPSYSCSILFFLSLSLASSLSRFIAFLLNISPLPSPLSHRLTPLAQVLDTPSLLFLILESSAYAWVILCMQMCAVHKVSETHKTHNSKTDRERERVKEREREWKREGEFCVCTERERQQLERKSNGDCFR